MMPLNRQGFQFLFDGRIRSVAGSSSLASLSRSRHGQLVATVSGRVAFGGLSLSSNAMGPTENPRLRVKRLQVKGVHFPPRSQAPLLEPPYSEPNL